MIINLLRLKNGPGVTFAFFFLQCLDNQGQFLKSVTPSTFKFAVI
jgi:hypothetical protein